MRLSLAPFLLLLAPPAAAFVLPSKSAFVRSASPLHVTIYGGDDGMDENSSYYSSNSNDASTQHNSWLYEDEVVDLTPTLDEQHAPLAQHLTTTPDYMGSLVRLAVAFSPPGQGLHLQDIDSVSVIGMDGAHLDIQAVVCAEEGCHTVQVPVAFPRECTYDDNEEECILHQLEELDHQAGGVLQRMEGDEATEEERQRQTQELHCIDRSVSYPTWWRPPPSMELFDECKNVQSLLNNVDFQPSIQGLSYSILEQRQDFGWTIEEAAVVDISASGMYIRARAAQGSRIFDLHVQFGAVATNVEDLRASVLGTVASATDMEAEEEYMPSPMVEDDETMYPMSGQAASDVMAAIDEVLVKEAEDALRNDEGISDRNSTYSLSESSS